MKCITNGSVVLEDGILENASVVYDDRILAVTREKVNADEVYDAGGRYVMPGFFDIHIHGYRGDDASDGDEEGLLRMAEALAEHGVTSFCPTTMTVPLPQLEAAFEAARAAMKRNTGARIAGINCEGPFISPAKKGAQDEKNILPPDPDFILKNADVIRLVTVAPEEDRDLYFVRCVAARSNIAVSVGHTSADRDTVVSAFDAGARHVTHLFNAMSPLNHRKPGCVGAALTDARATCEMICDTVHVHPSLYSMVYALKKDGLCLITDCMRAGGMPDGEYDLGGQKVTKKGALCLLEDGTIAGSVLTLDRALDNLLRYTGLALPEAVRTVSLDPARVIGQDKDTGSIAVGKRADITVAGEGIDVCLTVTGGKTTFIKN